MSDGTRERFQFMKGYRIDKDIEKKHIILALSGGIDSGMSIGMLKRGGWKKIYAANHVVADGIKSSSTEVLERARTLCEKEGIPFYIIEAQKNFSECVIDNFIERYGRALTPNPCVICNETLKFSWFYDAVLEKIRKEEKISGDEKVFFATGHYARIVEKDGMLFIARGKDRQKDQSYMLYRLPQSILERIVFPMGELYKKDLPPEAEKLGYSFEAVRESQDICFIEGDYGDYIVSHAPESLRKKIRPGRIVDMQGNYLGKHKGYIYYTVGQRKGLSLGNGPWYVITVDSETNTVTVGREDEQGQESFFIESTNWFADVFPGEKISCNVMVRYNSSENLCTAEVLQAGKAHVVLDKKAVVTPGQSAVFYQDDIVIGGGIICRN